MTWLFLIPIFLPLLASGVLLFLKNKQEKVIAAITQCTTIINLLAITVLSILWIGNGNKTINEKLVTLYETKGFVFNIQLYFDYISVAYAITGAILFFLIVRFSRYYLHREDGFKRFFSTLLIFLTGYNLVIYSGNFETLFIGWEFIGITSFLLIAFYRNRYLPVKNAFKTLSIYRISDIALILAMWMMHHFTHQNINFIQLKETETLLNNGYGYMPLFISCMIVLAAVAKSAQLPFTTWLPRAMEGPTSSSAIFYGSLSVHIGIFILLRTYPFWQNILAVKIIIITAGLLTAIIASLIAKNQPTVKTQIAYASAAQIGIIFIEVATGFHILALFHFAGNAFLRTYQLLVSPSVLNYLIHHQYFHHTPTEEGSINKFKNTLYTLAVKEWNIDSFHYRYGWSPFKWIGRKLNFLETKPARLFTIIPAAFVGYSATSDTASLSFVKEYLPVISMAIALSFILYSFASRKSAIVAWEYLLVSHFFILSGIIETRDYIDWTQFTMYAGGIMLAGITGLLCLQKIRSIDNDISLNRFHGYVYEQKRTGLLFILSALGLIGFPLTTSFIGIDVFFTHIHPDRPTLIILTALSFLFLELAAIRIYCRVFLGPHKKLNHPVAFRSS